MVAGSIPAVGVPHARKRTGEDDATVRSLLFLPYGGIILLPPRGELCIENRKLLFCPTYSNSANKKDQPCHAGLFCYNQHMYEYGIKFKRVIDGDTFVCDIDLGFGIWMVDQHCRLHGIDTPEKTTAEGQKCVLEAKFWFDDAAARLEKFTIQVEAKADKYGRRLVTVRSDKGYCTLNEQLVRDGLAVPYSGGSKSARKAVRATAIITDAT